MTIHNFQLGDQIVSYVTERGTADLSDIAGHFQIPKKTASTQLLRLQKKNRIKSSGPSRCVKTGQLLPGVYTTNENPHLRKTPKRIKPPETPFKTQWVNGAHPCAVFNPWTEKAA